ncbi:cell adhesion molecule 3-like isoform X1 [Branchiostoma lanceolatum]|uniref:cell adhesion molecule 3-like isoform X1 n=1 Tax=Branchiostoma lanceolatum TaxID=7740 RepID=UPI0034524A4D
MAQTTQRVRWICLCLVFATVQIGGVLAAVTDPDVGPLITDSLDESVLGLKCTAEKLSDPTATIAWHLDGPDGDQVIFAIKIEGDAANGTLKLTATTSFNVSGTGAVAKDTTYACKVARGAGTLWQAVTTGDPTPRSLRVEPDREQLYYGDTLTLACPNYGTQTDPDTLPADPLTVPSPQIDWQLNFTDTWTGSLPAGASVEDSKLIITNLGDSHVGSYTCRANNTYGTRFAFYPVDNLMDAPPTTAPPTTPSSGVAVNNTGAIVGGVIGGIIAAIILGALAFFGYQHYNKSQTARISSQPSQSDEEGKLNSS